MYLDPGFGSMIIQVVVAAIAGIGAVLFFLKDKIKALFSGKRELPEEQVNDKQE